MGGGGGSLSPTGCAVQTKLPTGLFVLSVPVWRGCGQREHHPGHLINPVAIDHVGSLAWDLWELEAIS